MTIIVALTDTIAVLSGAEGNIIGNFNLRIPLCGMTIIVALTDTSVILGGAAGNIISSSPELRMLAFRPFSALSLLL
jgi:hypothetical protein